MGLGDGFLGLSGLWQKRVEEVEGVEVNSRRIRN
jgi:hypothetical protein